MEEWSKSYDGPLKESAETWFVNRTEELKFLWKRLSDTPFRGPSQSYALIGLRRTGKTALMHKLFNRLFHEQDKIIPVYISFARFLHRNKPISAKEIADVFLIGYIRSYLAFKYRLPDLFDDDINMNHLRAAVEEQGDKLVPELFHRYDQSLHHPFNKHLRYYNLAHMVVNMPHGQARRNKMATVLFIDEFQVLSDIYDPDRDTYINLCSSFQKTAESDWSPMLVSGSSVSMLKSQALSGALSGRIQHLNTGPLEGSYAVKMIYRLSEYLNLPMTEALAETIYETTFGHPYSIERILFSRSPGIEKLPELEAIGEIVAYELDDTQGALGGHYEDEYGKYVSQLNGDEVARKILYWVTNQPSTPEEPADMHPRKIARTLGLTYDEVADALKKLHKIDVITHRSGTTYSGPTDPLLRNYLQYAHYRDIEDLEPADAAAKLRKELNRRQGEINRQVGHLTEIIVAGLLKQFDHRKVEGEPYFGIAGEALLPRPQRVLRREGVVKAGRVHEIDLISEHIVYTNGSPDNPGLCAWMISVRNREQSMGVKAVEEFVQDVAIVQREKEYGQLTRWYFSRSGFTEEAKEYLKREGIYFSDLAQFNCLANLFARTFNR